MTGFYTPVGVTRFGMAEVSECGICGADVFLYACRRDAVWTPSDAVWNPTGRDGSLTRADRRGMHT